MILVLRISFAFLDCEWISIYIKDLQIFESGFLIGSSSKVSDDLFEALDHVVSD